MSCDELQRLLAEGRPLTPAAEEHLATCAVCRPLLTALESSAEPPEQGQLERIKQLISARWKPARPLPSDHVLTSILLALFFSFSLLAGILSQPFGARALSSLDITLYYGVISGCAVAIAIGIVQQMIPGSKPRLNPRVTAILATVSLIAITFALFRDFDTEDFLLGTHCLLLGSICAAISGSLFWVIARTGLFVNPGYAGLVTGFFAGLAGFAVLAIHCTVLTTPHILVWHLTVLPLGALIGAGAGALTRWTKNRTELAGRNL